VGNLQRPLLIAFDLDGTLVDSLPDLADSANELIVELGGAPLSEDEIGRMIGEGAATLVRRALRASKIGDAPRAVSRFLEIYDTRLLNHTRPYDGIVDVVRAARAHGRVVVLTNKPRAASERILEGLALRNLFDEVIGGDGPYPRKPDPAGLLALGQKAGAAPGDSLLVGDSPVDHETATRAGAQCCLAAYGFGFANFPRERLTGRESVVGSPHELIQVIETFAASVRKGQLAREVEE
jgi:phosphoglycolate phosphatase